MRIKRFALGPLWTNCYIIRDSNHNAIIIDPSAPANDVENYIREKDLRVCWIILTHAHCDHIAGVMELRNLSEHGVAVHYADAPLFSDPGKNLSKLMLGKELTLPSPERELNDGDVLTAGSMTIEIMHTPGHTPGGICLLVRDGDEKILLSGDTLFSRSIGRSDLPGGSEKDLLESLNRLVDFEDELNVLPGHGPETTIGDERAHNPYWKTK